jgi:hypothetical protein
LIAMMLDRPQQTASAAEPERALLSNHDSTVGVA